MQSPPKRMTRARAAAKAGEPAVRTTKIVTAAARAKSTATSSTKSSSLKRKTRADDTDDEAEEEARQVTAAKKPTRGRPAKTAATDKSAQEEAPSRVTRGRPAKKVAIEAPEEQAAPVKTTRGRSRKVAGAAPEESAPEIPKKTTRGRAGTASTSETTTAKPAVKKTVKFQEPDKENRGPATKKEPATAGLRGRPARRGAATAARNTRKATKSTGGPEEKKPLSPKKVTQMPVQRDDESEDELAASGYTPVKPMQKSPVKPPSKVMPNVKEPEPTPEEQDEDATTTVNNAILNPPELEVTGLGSPARRMPSSAIKDSLKSPARKIGPIPLAGSALEIANTTTSGNIQTSPTKGSLLLSAAKRPPSPIKGLAPMSPFKSQQPPSATKASMLQSPPKRAMPGFKPFTESYPQEETKDTSRSPSMKPLITSTPSRMNPILPSEKLLMERAPHEDQKQSDHDEPFQEPIEKIQFSGRLSAVLPREADPSLDETETDVDEEPDEVQLLESGPQETGNSPSEPTDEQVRSKETEIELHDSQPQDALEPPEPMEEIADSKVVDMTETQVEESADVLSTNDPLPNSVLQPGNSQDELRPKDLDPFCGLACDSDTESAASDATKMSKLSKRGEALKAEGGAEWSFQPPKLNSLAESVASWSAPKDEAADAVEQAQGAKTVTSVEGSPETHFFEDEMEAHPVAAAQTSEASSQKPTNEADEDVFDFAPFTTEDVALQEEAENMSYMPLRQEIERIGEDSCQDDANNDHSHDEPVSEASQEYGDENQMPIDPAIMCASNQAPITPARPGKQKAFNTMTKVPLKPADKSTPSPLKKRSLSASRAGIGSARRATVVPLSPTRDKKAPRRSFGAQIPSTPAPTTPAKIDIWSTAGTPARTPRKDLDPALLRGAVVFVDVRTSEGAEASEIFVDLLTQMGARCVKSWNWNPSSPSGGDPSASRVGITHVVYKDGGKRTLEKVRETNGVVQCVGVSWVLDCERENQWLDEAPYYIDTSVIPRGGARRRKSMEPKALANMNGTLVNSASKSTSSRASLDTNTPLRNRRESAMWVLTPSDQGQEDQCDDIEWSEFILTPVPKTPAPEAIAKYAAEIPETPGGGDEGLQVSPEKQPAVTWTCPPKANPVREMGEGPLDGDQDLWLKNRLMAARRKSMQHAPKVASPLSKTWK